MLATIDRILAPVTWLVALLVVAALFVGPEVIGAKNDESPAATPAAVSGEAVFADSCASCHTLAAAGSTGSIGPNLDDLAPDAATVAAAVKAGSGSMPAFEGELTAEQIDAVAEYVSSAAGG